MVEGILLLRLSSAAAGAGVPPTASCRAVGSVRSCGDINGPRSSIGRHASKVYDGRRFLPPDSPVFLNPFFCIRLDCTLPTGCEEYQKGNFSIGAPVLNPQYQDLCTRNVRLNLNTA